MVKFIGEYCVKVDDKGRIIIPAPFKALFGKEERPVFVVKRDIYANCLQMLTFQEWEKESEEVRQRLNQYNREHAQFWREYMRGMAMVEPDEKIGRISIPKNLLFEIGVTKEVIFAGNNHKIEIWAKENYEKEKMTRSEIIALTEKILG